MHMQVLSHIKTLTIVSSPQGTNYRKTNAAMEMRLINRESFWARAEVRNLKKTLLVTLGVCRVNQYQ